MLFQARFNTILKVNLVSRYMSLNVYQTPNSMKQNFTALESYRDDNHFTFRYGNCRVNSRNMAYSLQSVDG